MKLRNGPWPRWSWCRACMTWMLSRVCYFCEEIAFKRISLSHCVGLFQGDLQYKFLSTDPEYISCGKTNCEVTVGSNCLVQSCSGSVSFRLINIRTDVFFVFFTGGLALPCVINTSSTLSFANPKSPLYGHLSSVDSTGTQVGLVVFEEPIELFERADSSV